jgi:hypothetical protein
MTRIRSSIALVAGLVLGLGGAAFAADMGLPVKAPPPPAPPPLDIHGFVEFDVSSFDINPYGQALINHATVTEVAGLDWTLYKNKGGFINAITVGGVIATDWSNNYPGYWGLFEPSANGDLFDVVMILSGSVTFGQYWTIKESYYNVYSTDVAQGPGVNNFAANGTCAAIVALVGCNGYPTIIWNELQIALNDSFTGWPITFNPYVTWEENLNSLGAGTAANTCFACLNNQPQFVIGMVPTWSVQKWWGIPLTFKVPTYVTVGPTNAWGGPVAGLGAPGSSGGVGMFTTGITGTLNLTWVPANLGHWYAKAGFQYYDIINANLQASDWFSICGTAFGSATGCSQNNWKNIFVGFGGIGVAF